MDQLAELQAITAKELISFFSGPKALRESKSAVAAAKLAVGTLSAVGRIRATERAMDGMQLEVLRNISANKEEYKAYLQSALPRLNPVALMAPDPGIKR